VTYQQIKKERTSLRGAHTKWKFKYGKELSPRALECECTQDVCATEDRSCGFERFLLSTLLQTLQQTGLK
jgi:hypothetical protein